MPRRMEPWEEFLYYLQKFTEFFSGSGPAWPWPDSPTPPRSARPTRQARPKSDPRVRAYLRRLQAACRTLGVSYADLRSGRVTAAQIEQAHRRLAVKYHPDRNRTKSAAARMARVNAARDLLKQLLEKQTDARPT